MTRWVIAFGAAAALAACGDDGEAGGAGGGDDGSNTTSGGGTDATSGGDPASTTSASGSGSGSGGGDTAHDVACASFCEGVQSASDAVGCGTIPNCAARYCDPPSSACGDQQNALYACYGSELSAGNVDGCFCEEQGEVECEDLCAAEDAELAACRRPLIDACIELDSALSEELDCELDLFDRCMSEADLAVGAGCGDLFFAYTSCVAADPSGCSCAGTDVECEGTCVAEAQALGDCTIQ